MSSSDRESLTSKVTKGGGWMLLTRFTVKGAGVAVSMILARLLCPDDYGVVAVGMLAITLLQVLTEVGFQQSLIQKRVNIEPFLNTAWTVGVIRGAVMSLITVLAAPWIANFFDVPHATNVVRGLAVYPFFQSLISVRILRLQKDLNFSKLFLYEISALFGPLIVGVGLAILWKNAWALVLGQLSSIFIQVVVSYCMFPNWPELHVNWRYAKDMFSFGKWVFWGGLVSYFAMRGDTYFVGKYFDAAALGVYTVAYRLSNMPVDEVKRSLARVLFPAYAKIGENPTRLQASFLNAYEVLLIIMLPTCVGVALVAADFVPIILGSKWAGMIPILELLSIAAAVRAFAIAGSGFFYGIGKPQIPFYQSALRGGVMLAFILPLSTKMGLLGVCIAVVLGNLSMVFHFFLYLIFVEKIGIENWSARLVPIFAAVTSMTLAVYGMGLLFGPGVPRLILLPTSGVIAYIMTLLLMWFIFYPKSSGFLKVRFEKMIHSTQLAKFGLRSE